MENLVVKFHKIFARHRPDLGKTDLVELTHEHRKPIFSSNLATLVHLRNQPILELALIQCYDIIATLPSSKYSSPISA